MTVYHTHIPTQVAFSMQVATNTRIQDKRIVAQAVWVVVMVGVETVIMTERHWERGDGPDNVDGLDRENDSSRH